MQLNYTNEAPQSIVIETVENTDILFENEYKKAIMAIVDIISQQIKSNGDICNKDSLLLNNRILFTGQRGSGKTSALLSLKNHLEHKGVNVPNKKENRKDNISFYCLPTIDPSYFEGGNNILTTVLSSMFFNAKRTMEKYEKDGKQKRNDYENLLRNFSKVYKAIGQIEPSRNNVSYNIEKLNDISNASDIHSLMDSLLKSFKAFLREDDKKDKTKFLLVIDDLDMNVSCAADMMEQLRKFLSLNDMIILMSANIDQLHYEMCEHYSKAFINTMNDKDPARFIEVEDMASRYLLKLFPTSRRINVEHPANQLLNATIAFREENGRNDDGEIKYKTIKQGELQPTILSLIWEKTRILFIPEKLELHPIIPTNLRELVQFIDVLEDMEKVESGDKKLFNSVEDYRKCENNINKFKEYFLKTWVPTNLSIEEETVFYSIPENVDEVNKYLINAINVIGTRNKRRLMSREVDLDIIEKNAEGVSIDRDIYTMVSPNDPRFVKANKISDIFNQPSNYSYGDLLLMLDKYETYFESERDRKFSNAIKIYYSILLFETMFYRSNNINYKIEKDGETIQESTLKNRVNDIISIQRLIGGTIYYPNYFEIITSKYFKQKGPSYDAKRAFYHKVKEDETDDMPLFSVLYYGDIRPDRYDTKHVYDTTFEHDSLVDSERYKTFDILSIINNMLNPWQTIARACGSELNISNWEEKIEGWATNYCQLDKKQFPNAILPFYSVDMMLKYIRKSYDVQKIDEHEDDKKYKNEEMISNWLGLIGYENERIGIDKVKEFLKNHHIYFSVYEDDKNGTEYNAKYENPQFTDFLKHIEIIKPDSSIDIEKINAFSNTLLKKLQKANIVIKNDRKYIINKETIDNKSNTLMVFLAKENIVKEQDGEYIINLKMIQQNTNYNVREMLRKMISIRVVKKGDDIIIYNYCDKKLSDGIRILTETKKYYKKIINTEMYSTGEKITFDNSLECFRDNVIANVMRLYSEGHREQAMLIKNLYRFNSITEMYRYLFDVLWKDAILEYCIRQEIQKTVHSRKFVKQYYKKLFDVTEASLIEALGKDGPYNHIYKNIFDQAVNSFIDETTK